MMRWLALGIAATALVLAAAGARAQQDPSDAVMREWQAESTQRDHLADAIRGVMEARKDAESRLKWVLDNWVKPEGKP